MLMIILAIVLTVAVLHFLFNCDPEAKPRADGVYFLGARWWAEKGRAAKHAAGGCNGRRRAARLQELTARSPKLKARRFRRTHRMSPCPVYGVGRGVTKGTDFPFVCLRPVPRRRRIFWVARWQSSALCGRANNCQIYARNGQVRPAGIATVRHRWPPATRKRWTRRSRKTTSKRASADWHKAPSGSTRYRRNRRRR